MINCHECGSERIVKNAHVFDRGNNHSKNNFQVYIDEDPNALVFKERTYHNMRAEICGDCGFCPFLYKSSEVALGCLSKTAKQGIILQQEFKEKIKL